MSQRAVIVLLRDAGRDDIRERNRASVTPSLVWVEICESGETQLHVKPNLHR